MLQAQKVSRESAPGQDCPDAVRLVEMLAGNVGTDDLPALLGHVDECAECAVFVNLMTLLRVNRKEALAVLRAPAPGA